MARKEPGKSGREGISPVREDVPDAAREWFESKAGQPAVPAVPSMSSPGIGP